jgi:outer membrane protein TolC
MKNTILNRYSGITKLLAVILAVSPFLALGQKQTLSLEQAIDQAKVRNRELRIDSLGIHKSAQQTAISRGLLKPNVSLTGQFQHYFQKPVFFGLNGNANSEKIDYARIGGEDVASAQVTLVQPLYNSGNRYEIQRRKLLEKQSKLIFQEKKWM